jgi:6-phosphogluconolactonase
MAERHVELYDDADRLAAEVSAQLVATLSRAQQQFGRAALALTAGSIMEKVWSALAKSDPDAVDWSRVDVFWGDERFVDAGSSDRNDVPFHRILLDHEPFSAVRHFPMPASDGEFGSDLDAAAAAYAQTLDEQRRPSDTGSVPSFDVVLLGVGPDGHCCSLFPGHPGTQDESSSVIPVRNSPKPPPSRMSLSFDGLNSAREIWVVVSGSGKAEAVAKALAPGTSRVDVPSSGAQGTERTVWLLDRDAAAELST